MYHNHFIDKQDKEVCRTKVQYASIMGKKKKKVIKFADTKI